jgi:hypothetical protein
MMVMFAAGVAHLAWMGVLGLVMVAEKTFPGGHRLPRPIGGVLAALAVGGDRRSDPGHLISSALDDEPRLTLTIPTLAQLERRAPSSARYSRLGGQHRR